MAALLLHAPVTLAALTADQIALITNKNTPQSAELARFYAQSRGIPADRIIELDVPSSEEIPFDRYERQVVPVIRKALRDRRLDQKVRCLVTFFGVPTRIADRIYTLPDNFEREGLIETSKRIQQKLATMVADVEKQAAEFDKDFKPASNGTTLEALAQRAERAGQSLSVSQATTIDAQARAKIIAAVNAVRTQFAAPVELGGAMTSSATAPAANAPSPATLPSETPEQLMERIYDRTARQQLRELARQSAGIFGYARIVQTHIEYLTTQESGAAVDSELSLLWWPTYPRAKFQRNLLNYRFREVSAPQSLMVMRIDAPTVQVARNLIANSIATEKDGLRGKFVIDARGIAARDAAGKDDNYGVFDEGLRRLATFVREKTKMQVVLDDKPDVLAPGSVDDVALYCGWYSLRHYIPGMKFNRGAVGYHVASFEMVNLHNIDERGWVQGLLKDGVSATLGPVAEPYLASFPAPEEFFPLLMTGKLTMAEVYWATCPLSSWMQSFIGDPLYTPFAKNPPLKVEDLPEPLRSAVQ